MYLVLDQGTSATKVFLFDEQRNIRFSSRRPHRLSRPAPNQAESDPLAILESCFYLLNEALAFARQSNLTIRSAGLAVQRSTFLFWERTSARPLTPAVSWQDTRAEAETRELAAQAELIQARTGVPLSAHFGGPKYLHLTRCDAGLRAALRAGKVLFGPLSAFLTQSLTGTAAVDHSIAGRALTMDLERLVWDPQLCALFDLAPENLPPLQPTVADFGTITIDDDEVPLRCVIGDQQAALLGQGGWEAGDLALNYGTSGSIALNSGSRPVPVPGLLASVLYSTAAQRTYLVEGTINTGRSLFDWLEQDLGIAVHRRRWDSICQHTATDGVLVPGYCGIAAPYWRDRFATVMVGIEPGDEAQLLRAALESIGFFTRDIIALIGRHLPLDLHTITASGGLSRASLLQFVADLLAVPVAHARLKDHTALGVCQLLQRADGIEPERQVFEQLYRPRMSPERRAAKISRWQAALRQAGIEPVDG